MRVTVNCPLIVVFTCVPFKNTIYVSVIGLTGFGRGPSSHDIVAVLEVTTPLITFTGGLGATAYNKMLMQ